MDKSIEKFLTASKFKNWIACNYTIINEINKKELKKKERTTTEKIRAERGDEFEENIYKELIKKYPKHIKIKKNDNKIDETKKAIKKGYDLIHKAYFENDGWHGEIDFLIKVEKKKTNLGNFGYEVYDTKLSSFEKTDQIIQLNIYNEWLEKLQGANEKAPDHMWLVLGNKENKKKYKVSDYQLYFKKNKDKYINFLNSDKKKTYPERCQFCNLCDWIDVCEKKWIEVDHLNQIAKIRKDQISKIKQQGIKTLAQFSNLKETEKIKDLNPAVFKTHLSQAKLLMKSKKSKKPEQNILPLKYERGFNKLPKSSNHDLFFDLEGIDKILNPEDSAKNVEGLEYLFGIYYIDNDKEVYLAYWSENQKEEEENFKKVLKFFNDHLKKYPECHIYHYNHYEKTALKKLMNKYDSNIEQINDLLREAKLVDLYNIVTQGMQVSEKEYSLKNLEKHYGFERIGEIQKANESTDKFLEWDETREKKLVEEIKLYNKEDCKSTKKLQEWLQEKKPKNASYQIPYLEERKDKNWEKEDEKYKKKIDNKKDKDLIVKENLKDILGFHKREEMVDWQNYFNRVETKNHEDLIEDPECIGNMSFLKKDIDEIDDSKKYEIYTYKFIPQDFKVKENKNIEDALSMEKKRGVGKTLIINESNEEHLVKIRRKKQKNSQSLPKVLSIIEQWYVPIKTITDAIKRFVDSYTNNEKKYKATYDILKKSYPDIKGIKKGDKIIGNDDFLKEALKVIENMNQTYLYFQGPPGVGKTHTAGFVILELLKKSKKIGVTGNSHKVIHNLLSKVEELAKNDKFLFEGFHQRSTGDDTYYKKNEEEKFIKNIDSKQMKSKFEKSESKENLFSGTKWCFSSLECTEKLDYLFVDEAGQLSIADIVAISMSAKNIVIIGDQMQLSSPTSALHAGESGKSIPEYLLENQDTIPSNKGVFIERSRRLHPDICKFVSENFYDNRLKSLEFTKKRKINFSKKEKLLSNTGIVFIDAKHKEICRQKSVEEAEIIKDLYEKIVGTSFTGVDEDKNTIDRPLDIKDILVVAPFNVQVNYLKSILPKNSRVGTIDKFQGQEAPVTIISMTSSDAESLPRNVDFYFSRNRLNVALSRSQCLSIVIMNKKILEINCKKVEHIRLVNTFMKLLNYEKKN